MKSLRFLIRPDRIGSILSLVLFSLIGLNLVGEHLFDYPILKFIDPIRIHLAIAAVFFAITGRVASWRKKVYTGLDLTLLQML